MTTTDTYICWNCECEAAYGKPHACDTEEPIRDSSGRLIAPPQTVIQPRPAGAWDTNTRRS